MTDVRITDPNCPGSVHRGTSLWVHLAILLPFAWLLTVGNLALAESAAANPADKKNVLIVGSSTMAPMIQELAWQFRRGHPDLEITIEAKGSGAGVKDTLSGRADIGMVTRPLKKDEKALFVIPIARDGTAFVVHQRNPIGALTRAQARDIFAGRIDNWKALGGPAKPIELLTRAKGQGVTEVVTHYLDLKSETTILSAQVWLNDDVVKAVTSRPGSLSILSIGVVMNILQKGLPIKALDLDGVKPDSDSIRNGSWPMARSLTLVTRSVPTGPAQAFIQFILSPNTESVILAHDFIPY